MARFRTRVDALGQSRIARWTRDASSGSEGQDVARRAGDQWPNAELLVGFAAWQRNRGFSEATIKRRRDSLRGLLSFADQQSLARMDRATIEAWVNQSGKPRTRRAYLSDARMLYKWAIRSGILERNPAEMIDGPRLPRLLPRPLSRAELTRALEAARPDARLTKVLMLGAFAGLRAGEIGALDGADIWREAEPPVVVVRDGKGGKDRAIPMHPELLAVLIDAPFSGPVFPNSAGVGRRCPRRHLSADTISKIVSSHFRALGIEGSTHRLRHTFGTEAARASGGDLVAVSSLMGHTSLTTTMGYVALAGGRAAEVTARLYM
jgi:integrase